MCIAMSKLHCFIWCYIFPDIFFLTISNNNLRIPRNNGCYKILLISADYAFSQKNDEEKKICVQSEYYQKKKNNPSTQIIEQPIWRSTFQCGSIYKSFFLNLYIITQRAKKSFSMPFCAQFFNSEVRLCIVKETPHTHSKIILRKKKNYFFVLLVNMQFI